MLSHFTFGRRLYLFTRPDGVSLVDKPKCCRRLFNETVNINRAKTFAKIKTADAASIAWESFIRKKNEAKETEIYEEMDAKQISEETIKEIDELLKEINQTNV